MLQRLMLLLAPLYLFAEVHYAKVEPVEEVVLKSAVSGLVIEANRSSEGAWVLKDRIVHIDDALEKEELNATKQSVVLFQEMVSINQQIEASLRQSVKRQKSYYERLSKLSTASKTQKDNAYNAYASAKTQYLGIKEKIASLKKQLLDLHYKVKRLEDIIKKKSIVAEHTFLKRLLVHPGEYVTPGMPVAQTADISQAKLVLFLSAEELKELPQKRLFIEGKPTPYHISKVWKTVDETFISSYRAEVYLPKSLYQMGRLVKVELK